MTPTRKAYRRAKQETALATAAASLPTPVAEEPYSDDDDSGSSTSEEEASSGSSGNEGEEDTSTSNDEAKSPKQKARKDKWIAVKKESNPGDSDTSKASEAEDTSSVDALVDAVTKTTPASASDALVQPSA